MESGWLTGDLCFPGCENRYWRGLSEFQYLRFSTHSNPAASYCRGRGFFEYSALSDQCKGAERTRFLEKWVVRWGLL